MNKHSQALFYSNDELASLGLRFGNGVFVDRTAILINPDRITIGSNVRIDAFTLLTASHSIEIGSFVHISAGSKLYGGAGICLADYVGLSANVTIFSTTDDYSQGYMSNPTVPEEFKMVSSGRVTLQRHSLVGCGSVIMPKVTLGVGCSVGALSYVNKSIPDFMIVSGNPLRRIGMRNGGRLQGLEKKHQDWIKSINEIKA